MPNKQPPEIAPPPPLKFSLHQWHLNNRHRYRCSEAQQELADRLLNESQRVCELSSEKVRNNKDETDHRLKEKIEDIEFRKRELLRIRKEVLLEIDALSIYKERIMDALSSVRKNAFVICEKCLIFREHRLGIDLVHDDIEKELLKECEVIKGVESLLVRTLEQTQEQIRRLKATLYYMDHELEDKENNLRIDKHNLTLKETNLNLSIYHGTSRLDPSTIELNEWEMQTNNNIVSASKEVNSARPLRCYIDTIIKQVINDLNDQKNATDEAFRRRIEETKEAKIKLELQHAEIMRQAAEMKDNITRIEKSIAEKESFLALAHTRLGNRCQRPGLELTRDLVEINLVKEVYDLREIVSKLQATIFESQASLRYLLKTQIQIEEDINVKINTLKIDEVDCMTLRQSMDYHTY
ncbi:tektin C [Bombus vancouverensis nearcticus]|uniref:Tektin n=1 Tax=Bombus bifarius TaxID=103933 RepID=A0A6P8ML26_9HYME|nr:tektin-1 [Bombus vancouverensis nearcticus]XP_033185088.1 tektin-1 [Bombus vancouverensis nearcticus]XP_033185089.1 tektin-1 [Bombus vancouverensis nearcticus]XP_033185090.1 tektin-1 [Bombus vancouverensis nearcticus]XP_033302698.1 tektin-1 [Bombus bifarius]XP_033302699.1 tektin-1 [Bombus bifarius]XP_033302700.1 tektin-1 [Bombus bifarius]XP_033302702.1 tektin-1 [Bombus bifarius]